MTRSHPVSNRCDRPDSVSVEAQCEPVGCAGANSCCGPDGDQEVRRRSGGGQEPEVEAADEDDAGEADDDAEAADVDPEDDEEDEEDEEDEDAADDSLDDDDALAPSEELDPERESVR